MQAQIVQRIQRIIDSDNNSPNTLKNEILDLAKYCQVTPSAGILSKTIFGPLEDMAEAVFGRFSLLLVMTEPRRRQIYFAVLARLKAKTDLESLDLDGPARLELLTNLILSRNEYLIEKYYGSCPQGFLRLICQFGESARQPKTYTQLFELLNASHDLAQPISDALQQGRCIDDLIDLMHELPETVLGVRVANQFRDLKYYKDVMKVYCGITRCQSLSEAHMHQIASGESPKNLLEGLYLDLPFPAPVLSGPTITYVPNGRVLVHVAKQFQNCLADFVAEALNGERQFYLWKQEKQSPAVFSIDSEAPFGWYLSDAQLRNNIRLPRGRREVLKNLLECEGVRTGRSVENMMRYYRGNLEDLDL